MRDRVRSDEDAHARGAHLRMQTLMYERRTADALRLANKVIKERVATKGPRRESPEAYLRLRFDYDRARLLARRDDPEAIREARELLASTLSLIRFENEKPLISGDRRFSLMNELAGTLSTVFGEHALGATVAERLLERAEGAANASRIQIALSNGGEHWRRHGYAEACAGQLEAAEFAYKRGQQMLERTIANNANHLSGSDDVVREASQLVRRAILLLVRLDQVVIDDEPARLASRSGELDALRLEAGAIVRESDLNPVIPPVDRIARYARLGQVLVEFGRASEARDRDLAQSMGSVARAFLQPVHEIHSVDGDARPELTIRYADACRLSGDHEGARRSLALGLARLEARCGEGYGPCLRMRARLRAVDS